MTAEEESRLSTLREFKERLAEGRYVVEPRAVADAILRRLQLQLMLVPSEPTREIEAHGR